MLVVLASLCYVYRPQSHQQIQTYQLCILIRTALLGMHLVAALHYGVFGAQEIYKLW